MQAKASKLDQTVAEEERSIKQVLLRAKKMEEEADKAHARAVERKQKVLTRVLLPCVGSRRPMAACRASVSSVSKRLLTTALPSSPSRGRESRRAVMQVRCSPACCPMCVCRETPTDAPVADRRWGVAWI